jgi:hypothetical protein
MKGTNKLTESSNNTKIGSVQNLLEVLSKQEGIQMFRGQTRDWPLIPSIGRYPKVVKLYLNWQNCHEQIIHQFLRLGHPFLSEKQLKDSDRWVIGQHHGLPTRLLDTTTNPLKALFFSVNIPSDDKYDGTFWIINYSMWNEELDDEHRIYWDTSLIPFLPPQLDARLMAQEGAFISYPLPKNDEPLTSMEELKENDMTFLKMIVPSSAKARLRRELEFLGIQFRFLFPDLDGVSRGIHLSSFNF